MKSVECINFLKLNKAQFKKGSILQYSVVLWNICDGQASLDLKQIDVGYVLNCLVEHRVCVISVTMNLYCQNSRRQHVKLRNANTYHLLFRICVLMLFEVKTKIIIETVHAGTVKEHLSCTV